MIVVVSPVSDEDLGFLEGSEDFSVEEFIPKLAVKRLDIAVFPGTAWLDEKRLDSCMRLTSINSPQHNFAVSLQVLA